MSQDQSATIAKIQMSGITVEITKHDTGEAIGFVLVAAAAIYVVIRAVNYVFNKIKNRHSLWQ